MVTTDAKLSLVEFLLAADDVSVCAQHGLEWLSTHVGVQRALCATTAVDPRRYWGVAALGISPAQTGEFFLDLEDLSHPLIAAVFEPAPVHFPVGPRQPETPLESTPFTVLPLRSGQLDRKAVGLLLLGTDQPTLDPDILWFVEVLGEKLTRLRGRTVQSLSLIHI